MNESTVVNEVIENVATETAKQSHWGFGEVVVAGLVLFGIWKVGEVTVSSTKCVYNAAKGLFNKGEQQTAETIDITNATEVQDEPENE